MSESADQATAAAPAPATPALAAPVLVLGMHRGGTSALAGVLHRLGFDLGPSLMEAAEGVNDKGFFEHVDAFRIHERLFAALGRSRFDPREMPAGWREHPAFRVAVDEVRALIERDFASARFWSVKDPRLCRLAPVWITALGAFGVAPKIVLIARHPLEVARSLQAQRWVVSAARSHLCWLQHMLEAERATRGLPRSLVTYGALLADWRAERERIARELALEWPDESSSRGEEIDAFLDARERRFDEANLVAGNQGPEVPRLALDLFDACRAADAQADPWRRIADIGEIYERGAAAFGPCLDEAIVEASLATLAIGQGSISVPVAAEPASSTLPAAIGDLLDARLAPLRDSIERLSERIDESMSSGKRKAKSGISQRRRERRGKRSE